MPNMAYDELIARLTLQKANIATYTTDVGATVEEIADITNDLANLEYARDYADVVDGNKKTVTQIKRALFDGDPKGTIPDYPAFTAGTLPQAAKAGAFQRYMDRGKRWKTAPGYTAEIGTALSYNGTPPKPDPNTAVSYTHLTLPTSSER
ncbi:MAG: hypothetical protein QUS14_18255, partial [Pyrinomonadaceae bacterium]|nr:hypothetical protein [Pyrinomonadaceae bacterium]